MPVRQDQKPAVVGYPFQAVVLVAEAPTDPAITRGTFQGGGGEAEDGDPLATAGSDIPDCFADFGQGLEIVMLMHQFLKLLLFR